MSSVKQVLKEHQVTWRSFEDPDDSIDDHWNITGIPNVFLISHDGIILKNWVELGSNTGDEIDQAIQDALAAMRKEN